MAVNWELHQTENKLSVCSKVLSRSFKVNTCGPDCTGTLYTWPQVYDVQLPCHSNQIQTFTPPPPPPPHPSINFLNSPPIRFKPGTQKALLHLIQVQFFEWSCLFWWPNLVIQAGHTSTESLRGLYSYLRWGDQMYSHKTRNLCEKRHSNFSTVFNLSLKIHKD